MAHIELVSKDQLPPRALVDDDKLDELTKYRWTWAGGYASTRMKQPDGSIKNVLMHRLLVDAQPGDIVDHINRKKLDNRLCNLRVATTAQNNANRGKADVGRASSIYVGLSRKYDRAGWRVTVAGIDFGTYED